MSKIKQVLFTTMILLGTVSGLQAEETVNLPTEVRTIKTIHQFNVSKHHGTISGYADNNKIMSISCTRGNRLKCNYVIDFIKGDTLYPAVFSGVLYGSQLHRSTEYWDGDPEHRAWGGASINVNKEAAAALNLTRTEASENLPRPTIIVSEAAGAVFEMWVRGMNSYVNPLYGTSYRKNIKKVFLGGNKSFGSKVSETGIPLGNKTIISGEYVDTIVCVDKYEKLEASCFSAGRYINYKSELKMGLANGRATADRIIRSEDGEFLGIDFRIVDKTGSYEKEEWQYRE